MKIPTVFYLITIKVITGIPFGIFQSMFSLVSMEFFKLEPQHNGFVMSYVGGLSIVSKLKFVVKEIVSLHSACQLIVVMKT